MVNLRKNFVILLILALIEFQCYSQTGNTVSDKELQKFLCSSFWTSNTWLVQWGGLQFYTNGRVETGNYEATQREYYIENGIIYISKKKLGQSNLDGDIENKEYSMWQIEKDNKSIFSSYALVNVESNERLYSVKHKMQFGQTRIYDGYNILIGDVPLSLNDNESYFYKPTEKNPIVITTFSYNNTQRVSIVYSISDCKKFGDSVCNRFYIGSTIINGEKWYLVSLNGNPEGSETGDFSKLVWTMAKPYAYPYVMYNYYYAILTGELFIAYNIWHKKSSYNDWIMLYNNISSILVLNCKKLENKKWELVVLTITVQNEKKYFKVTVTLNDNSIVDSLSKEISENEGMTFYNNARYDSLHALLADSYSDE